MANVVYFSASGSTYQERGKAVGPNNPQAGIVDEEILGTILDHIERMLTVLPPNVTNIEFYVTIDALTEKEHGGYWVHDHGNDYQNVIEQMALEARFCVPDSQPSLARIDRAYITLVFGGTVIIQLIMYDY